MKLEILYEDEHILAINKPAGIMVHGDGKNTQETIADFVVAEFPQTKDVGEPIETTEYGTVTRPGIVHRLDKDTSGVLLIAKTPEGHTCLKEQFQNHTIIKEYRAFVYGNWNEERGRIDAEVSRSKTFAKWTAIPKAVRGKTREASTDFRVIKSANDFTYISVLPRTGRTHQIRVHMQYRSHPVVGDTLYAGKRFDGIPEHNLGFRRQALHAYKITFTNLATELVTVEAPFPEDFQAAIALHGA
jgi:23S rRNA pseudouridine1911/1915/1917 synthase